MAKFLSVNLRGRVAGGASLEFLRAEMNAAMATPFAHVRYSLDGVEQKNGFRVDLDKRIILDRLGDPAKDDVIERAAVEISDLLNPIAGMRDTMALMNDPLHSETVGSCPLHADAFPREINDLHHVNKFDVDEIAELFGFPEDDVRATLHNYRRFPVRNMDESPATPTSARPLQTQGTSPASGDVP